MNRHFDKTAKIGSGVLKFVIFETYALSAIGVKIIRLDNSEIDFSWVKCMNLTAGKGNRQHIISAFRQSIMDQIYEYKYKINTLKCSKCNSICNIQVDHYNPTFMQMYEEFTTLNLLPDEVEQNPFNLTFNFLKKDDKYSTTWQMYHRKNAKLRLLCKFCNCSRKKYK